MEDVENLPRLLATTQWTSVFLSLTLLVVFVVQLRGIKRRSFLHYYGNRHKYPGLGASNFVRKRTAYPQSKPMVG